MSVYMLAGEPAVCSADHKSPQPSVMPVKLVHGYLDMYKQIVASSQLSSAQSLHTKACAR